MPGYYPIPWPTVLSLSFAILLNQPRSFRHDALTWISRARRPLQVIGRQHIPATGPCLLAFNHYRAPGYEAWYTPLAISTLIPQEIHWVMAANWTFIEPNGRRHPAQAVLFGPLTRWLFARLACVYGFTAMPAMPPDPREVEARTQAVRQVLDYTHRTAHPMVGLAPEGGDSPDGALAQPPAGAGRFLIHLSQRLGHILPVGAYTDGDGDRVAGDPVGVVLSFGEPYQLALPTGLSADERDHQASRITMQAIARQLPPRLRGVYR